MGRRIPSIERAREKIERRVFLDDRIKEGGTKKRVSSASILEIDGEKTKN